MFWQGYDKLCYYCYQCNSRKSCVLENGYYSFSKPTHVYPPPMCNFTTDIKEKNQGVPLTFNGDATNNQFKMQ